MRTSSIATTQICKSTRNSGMSYFKTNVGIANLFTIVSGADEFTEFVDKI